MSRYWIWKDALRTPVGRQVVLYWTTSVVCMALTSLATGAIASLAPAGHRFHLAVVAVGFPAVTLIFWLAKFVLYQRVIFPGAPERRVADRAQKSTPLVGRAVALARRTGSEAPGRKHDHPGGRHRVPASRALHGDPGTGHHCARRGSRGSGVVGGRGLLVDGDGRTGAVCHGEMTVGHAGDRAHDAQAPSTASEEAGAAEGRARVGN